MAEKLQCAVQINDLLIKFFSNQKKLLDITFFNKHPKREDNICSLHIHSYAELFACKSGTIALRSPQMQMTLKAGDVAVIPAGVMHTKVNSATAEPEWVSAGVLCTQCKTTNETGLFDSVSRVLYGDSITVIPSSKEFYDITAAAVKKTGESVPLQAKLRLASAFCELAIKSQTFSDGTVRHTKPSKTDIDRLMRLDNLINGSYAFELSNKQVADDLFLSVRQLSRFVNRYYGVPLHTLIINKRISAAAAMLVETDNGVEQIAQKVGFNGKTGFYREFQKAYGLTPLQYRKEFAKRDKIDD